MRNANYNTRMAKRNLIVKTIFRVTMLLTIFVFVFAFVCVVADANLVSQIENGTLNNVAEASGNNGSKLIDFSGSNCENGKTYIITPDVTYRGHCWTTDTEHTRVNTWTNDPNNSVWGIGNDDYHSGTDYAHCWFDYKFGSLRGTIKLTATRDSDNSDDKVSGWFLAINDSSSEFSTITSGSTGYDTDVKNKSGITKSSESQTSISLSRTISNSYVRIYFVTYSTTGDYGKIVFKNVKVTFTPSNSSTGTSPNTVYGLTYCGDLNNQAYNNRVSTNFSIIGNATYSTGDNDDQHQYFLEVQDIAANGHLKGSKNFNRYDGKNFWGTKRYVEEPKHDFGTTTTPMTMIHAQGNSNTCFLVCASYRHVVVSVPDTVKTLDIDISMAVGTYMEGDNNFTSVSELTYLVVNGVETTPGGLRVSGSSRSQQYKETRTDTISITNNNYRNSNHKVTYVAIYFTACFRKTDGSSYEGSDQIAAFHVSVKNVIGDYYVNYKPTNGTTFNSPNPTIMTYNTVSEVAAPEQVGHRFTGWMVTSGLVNSTAYFGTSSSNVSTNISGESQNCYNGASSNVYFKNLTNVLGATVDLTANFETNTLTVKYNANGGSGTIDNLTMEYNVEKNLSNNKDQNDEDIFKRIGYILVGWSLSSGDNATKNYDLGHSVTNTISNKDLSIVNTTNSRNIGEVNLYAVWAESDFGDNGESGDWGSEGHPYIISTLKHLNNLAQIVNGELDPVDSRNGTYYGRTITGNAGNNGDITYSGCYFKISGNIGNSNSPFTLVIGKDDQHYFMGNIYGAPGAVREVYLGITATQDIAGLFGYVKGTSTNKVNIKNIKTTGQISASDYDYVGGIVAHGEEYVTLESCKNSATINGNNYVGGIAGYLDSVSIKASCTNDGGTVNGAGNRIGGFFGYAKNIEVSISLTNASSVNGTASVNNNIASGSSYVGGIIGYLENDCNLGSSNSYSYINNGNVKGCNFVGGVFGFVPSGISLSVNKLQNILDSNHKVIGCGQYIGGIIGRNEGTISGTLKNNGNVYGYSSDNQNTRTAYYVGGLIGYNSGNLSSMVIYSDNNNGIGVSGIITGASYVGGVIGATYNSQIKISTSINISTNVVSGSTTNTNNIGFCGGVFGYVAGTGANTNYNIALSNNNDNYYRFTNASYSGTFAFNNYGNYVGGIAGYATGIAIENQTSTGSDQSWVYYNNDTDIRINSNGICVGGVVGYLASSAIHKEKVGSVFETLPSLYDYAPKNQLTSSSQNSIVYPGQVYYYTYTYTIDDNSISYTIYMVPTIYGIIDYLPSNGNNYFIVKEINPFLTENTNVNISDSVYNSYLGTTIYGKYSNKMKISGQSYVGGLIGKIDSGVGDLYDGDRPTNSNSASGSIFSLGDSHLLYLYNEAPVEGSHYYIGGTIGAVVNNTTDSTIYYITYLYPHMANVASYVGTENTIAENTNTSFVGGLIGTIGTINDTDAEKSNVLIGIVGDINNNINNGSFNGNKNAEKVIRGHYFVGGVVGYINSNTGNYIHNFVNLEKIDGGSYGVYIGGIVGYMGAGSSSNGNYSISNCISTSYKSYSDSIDYSTSNFVGQYYVGGIIGQAGAVVINNCYVTGYAFDKVDFSNGGICGNASGSTTFISSWAILLFNDMTDDDDETNDIIPYTLSYLNQNGKFILVQNRYDWSIPSLKELYYLVGLTDSINDEDRISSSNHDHTIIDADKRFITFKLLIPKGTCTISNGTMSNRNISDKYISFFNGDGRRTASVNKFVDISQTLGDYSGFLDDNSNTYLYVETYSNNAQSYTICVETASFVNVQKTKSSDFAGITNNQDKIDLWVLGFNNGRFSDEYIANFSSIPIRKGNDTTGYFDITCDIMYKNTIDTIVNNQWLVGVIVQRYYVGSREMPLTISNKGQYESYITAILSGEHYTNKWIKLLNDLDLEEYSESNKILWGIPGNQNYYFAGNFDGNGKTLTYSYNDSTTYDGIGLFPVIKSNVQIVNLFVKANIKSENSSSSGGTSVGGIVGLVTSSATLTMTNCKSLSYKVSTNPDKYSCISGFASVGGLIGKTEGNIFIVNCVNTNDVLSTKTCSARSITLAGVGGIIGSVNAKTANIDSSTNKGYIKGFQSVGGMIGYVNSNAEITNCCNVGSIYAGDYQESTFSYAGGICGQVTGSGHVNVYATYNTGDVTGTNARVGGILGCDTTSQQSVSTSVRTKVMYCYNSGTIVSGYSGATGTISNEQKIYYSFSGGEVGGIVGMGCNLDLYYCYNVGDITCYGYIYNLKEHHVRAGGLVGMMWNYNDKSYGKMEYCYNAGFVRIRTTTDNPIYASGLVGCYIYQDAEANEGDGYKSLLHFHGGLSHSGQHIKNNYSMYGQVDVTGRTFNNDKIYGIVKHDVSVYSGKQFVDSCYNAYDWTVEGDVRLPDYLICGYDGTNGGTRPYGMGNWSSSGSTVTLNGVFNNTSNFGYIYIPGCLPQLAVFALDTETGISMTGKTSGYDSELQSYITNTAGSKYSPYVIQNGVDLLGLSQLFATDNLYDGDGKYYAFADGYNNLDGYKLTSLDMNTLNLTNKANMPLTYTSYSVAAVNEKVLDILVYAWYCQQPTGTVTTHSNNKIYYSTGHGKSAALYRRKIETNSSNYLKNNLGTITYDGQNFFQIASTTSGNAFKGILSGFSDLDNNHNEIVYPEIINLKMKRRSVNAGNDVYAGLIGYGDGCSLQNFAIGSGSTITVDLTANNKNCSIGAFVGKAVNSCLLYGLEVHNGLTISVSLAGFNSIYAGGFVGTASPNLISTDKNTITINNCSFNGNIDISSDATNYVGGIVGYAYGISSDTSVGIDVTYCDVVGGTISNASTKTSGIGTGGIVGYRNLVSKLTIKDCTVGNGLSNLIIEGNNMVGGVISYANCDDGFLTTINHCTVGNKTTIKRVANGHDHDEYGTAFGGFVGYTKNCTIKGGSSFGGTIIVGIGTASNDFSYGENVGGLIGYLGSNTSIENDITIVGTINAGNTNSSSIGGAIGYAPPATHNINGKYYINPTMITTNSTNVGGFIGYNEGTIYLLGTASIVDNSNTALSSNNSESQAADDLGEPQEGDDTHAISANSNVGGFVGWNAGVIKIGTQTESIISNKSVGTFSAKLVAGVNGVLNVGGFVGLNSGEITTKDCKANVINSGNICNESPYYLSAKCIGGIVGCNEADAYFLIEEKDNYFANSGTIGKGDSQNRIKWAGGIVGYNGGSFTNIGTLANTGAIYGYEYVAGSIGYFNSGTLFGTMINGVAKTNDSNVVSRSTKDDNYPTKFKASTDSNLYPDATEIGLTYHIDKGANYSYSIGKVTYYFTAPIGGEIVGLDNDNISVVGTQLFSGTKHLTDTTNIIKTNSEDNNYPTLVTFDNTENANNSYKYSYGSQIPDNYFYESSEMGVGFVKEVEGHKVTFYPTLFADYKNDLETLGNYTSLGGTSSLTASANEENKILYKFDANSNYCFDATYLTGTIAYKKDGAIAFSSLSITASKTPLEGAIPIDSNVSSLRIKAGLSYSFYIGTIPYFFNSMVSANITSINGKVVTLGEFSEESFCNTALGKDIVKGKKYILKNGNTEYWFTSDVDGKIPSTDSNFTNSSVNIETIIKTSTSALASLTPLDIGESGKTIQKGTNYKFKINGSSYYYFKANYTGNITFLGKDNNGYVIYGISNTDYTDMEADDTQDSLAGLVSGKTNIGGVVSMVNNQTTIGLYKENDELVEGVKTQLINFGVVESINGENVGGSIGMMSGQITGEAIDTNNAEYVEFYNYGEVNVVKNGGGCIGIYSGNGNYVKIYNYQHTSIYNLEGIDSYENIGGCIGLVSSYVPITVEAAKADDNNTYYNLSNNSYVEINSWNGFANSDTVYYHNDVRLINSEIINSGVVTAYTTRPNVVGYGFGGVVGTIADGAVSLRANWNPKLYSDGSVYCGLSKTNALNSGHFSKVGGLIGSIGNAPIVLESVLNYTNRSSDVSSTVTAVTGYNYVGGIVGYNNSSIGSSYTGENAAVINCYNVGGKVYGHYSDSSLGNTVGGIVGGVGPNNPNTYRCYWVSEFSNNALQRANVNSLGSSLTKDWEVVFSEYDVEDALYYAKSWEDYFIALKYYYGLGYREYSISSFTTPIKSTNVSVGDSIVGGHNYSYLVGSTYYYFTAPYYSTIKKLNAGNIYIDTAVNEFVISVDEADSETTYTNVAVGDYIVSNTNYAFTFNGVRYGFTSTVLGEVTDIYEATIVVDTCNQFNTTSSQNAPTNLNAGDSVIKDYNYSYSYEGTTYYFTAPFSGEVRRLYDGNIILLDTIDTSYTSFDIQSSTKVITNSTTIAIGDTLTKGQNYSYSISSTTYYFTASVAGTVKRLINGKAIINPGVFVDGSSGYYVDNFTYQVQRKDSSNNPILDNNNHPIWDYYDYYDIIFASDGDPLNRYKTDAIATYNDTIGTLTGVPFVDENDKGIPALAIISDIYSTTNSIHDRAEQEFNHLTDVVSIKNYNNASFETNDNGEIGYIADPDNAAKVYSTGNIHTGYFFAYAKDAEADYSDTGILTQHTQGSNTEAGFDLGIWKVISHAYGYKEYETKLSSLVYNYAKADLDSANSLVNRSSTKAQEAHIYAKAYMPTITVNNVATPTGYYLYAQAQSNTGIIVSYNAPEAAFYIDADASVCQNVLIYYKKTTLRQKITYNGLQRVAPIEGLTATATTNPHGTYYQLNDHATTNNMVFNTGTDVGTYYLDSTIYYIPDNAFKFATVGTAGTEFTNLKEHLEQGQTYTYKNASNQTINFKIPDGFRFPNADPNDPSDYGYGWLAKEPAYGANNVEIVCPVVVGRAVSDTTLKTYKWSIAARQLTVVAVNKNTSATSEEYSKETKSVTITVTGIISGDTVEYGNYENTHPAYSNLAFKVTTSSGIQSWTLSITKENTPVTSSTGYTSVDGGYCADNSYKTYHISTYLYTLNAVNAGTYSIEIEKDKTNSNTKANNYNISVTKAILVIKQKELTLTTSSTDSVEYNGNSQPINLYISGWAANETIGSISTANSILKFVYDNKSKITTNMSVGTITASNTSSGQTTSSTIITIPYSATNVGNYYIHYPQMNFGQNYVLSGSVSDIEFAITPLVLNCAMVSEWGTNVYKGGYYSYVAKIYPKESGTTLSSTLCTNIASIINSTNNVKATVITTAIGATVPNATVDSTNNIVKVTFNAINVGTYYLKILIFSDPGENFALESEFTGGLQEITKTNLTLSYISTGTSCVYNQDAQGLTSVSLSGFVGTDANLDTTTIASYINFVTEKTSYSTASFSAQSNITYNVVSVNVGSYYCALSLKSDQILATNYYITGYTETTFEYYWSIAKLNIECVWSDNDTFTYDGTAKALELSAVIINGTTLPISGGSVIYSRVSSYSETISFIYGPRNNNACDVGLYYSEVTNYSVSGTNVAGDASKGNYMIINTVGEYSIIESHITTNLSPLQENGINIKLRKTYDGTSDVVFDIDKTIYNYIDISFDPEIPGTGCSPDYSIIAQYESNIVGDPVVINYTIVFDEISLSNYIVDDVDYIDATKTIDRELSNGAIDRKNISITLNTKTIQGQKYITKVFDNNASFGGTGTTGSVYVSNINRTGNGFSVNGIVDADKQSNLTISAVFAEVQTGRSAFDKYVNNVIVSEGEYVISDDTTYYKKIVFTLIGTRAKNYRLLFEYNDEDHDAVSITSSTVTIDNQESEQLSYVDNANMPIHVTITPYTVNVEYDNIYQSYAQTFNTYTCDTVEGWTAVDGSIVRTSNVDDDLRLGFVNNWMYENHQSGSWARIVKHTKIIGIKNSDLYAYLYDINNNGININYALVTQPILTIDYFVPEDNTVHKITTLASLMMATYYYNNYANLDNNPVYTYERIYSDDDEYSNLYNSLTPAQKETDVIFDPATGKYFIWKAEEVNPIKYNSFILDADISGIMTKEDYDILKNAFSDQQNNPIWGYNKGFDVGNSRITYLTNFLQTNVGEEVVVIGNFFANEFDGKFDGNGHVIKNFIQIYNVVSESTTEVNIGFFGKAKENAIINNIALREYKLYVYDYTSFGNTLNIGALIGLSVMNSSLNNSTIHASINVNVSSSNSIVNIGILMGRYEGTIEEPIASIGGVQNVTEYHLNVAIENVIVLGNIEVDNIEGSSLVGGIIGSIAEYGNNGRSIYNPISFTDINVTSTISYVGGIIGYTGNDASISSTVLDSEECNKYINNLGVVAYLKNAVIQRENSSAVWNIVNKAIGNVSNSTVNTIRALEGTTYETFMSKSNTALINRTYLPENTTLSNQIYDVISEFKENPQNHSYSNVHKYESYQTSGASNEPRESTRLVDIVRVYILKYNMNIVLTTSNDNAVRGYQVAESNVMLGNYISNNKIIGTSDNRIALSYAQHTTLLRMLRFASFELKKQINLPVNYYNIVYSGVFYGNITTPKVIVIAKNAGDADRTIGGNNTYKYSTLEEYQQAYAKYYHIKWDTLDNSNYSYTPHIYVYHIESEKNKMFEVEINSSIVPIDWMDNE